eukprot:gnl/Spiro4/3573_TR1756_c0_g1_i1.p3 gnl/Spiro4/3573_TR1756_c0_g1~~gnl/Spiro4/3573_TR1756_c0_g1_i1.p3  ORF type:complete len:151 (+),score=6.23 gnl/Spiro4/3573_TR1756_c0_g1_i1:397-849(+)
MWTGRIRGRSMPSTETFNTRRAFTVGVEDVVEVVVAVVKTRPDSALVAQKCCRHVILSWGDSRSTEPRYESLWRLVVSWSSVNFVSRDENEACRVPGAPTQRRDLQLTRDSSEVLVAWALVNALRCAHHFQFVVVFVESCTRDLSPCTLR